SNRCQTTSRRTSSSWGSGRLLAMGLNAIAVRIDDEGGVVVRAVVRAQPRLAVVAPAGLQRRGMEGVDRLPVGRLKADMQAGFLVGRHRMLGLAEPEPGATLAVAGRALAAADPVVAQRLQHRVVELLRLGEVAHPDG